MTHPSLPTGSNPSARHPQPRSSQGLSHASFRVFGQPPPFRTPGLKPARAPFRENRTNIFGRALGTRMRANAGKVRPIILLWALGLPLPVILLVWLFKGCV